MPADIGIASGTLKHLEKQLAPFLLSTCAMVLAFDAAREDMLSDDRHESQLLDNNSNTTSPSDLAL